MIAGLAFTLLQLTVGVASLACFDCIWFDAEMLSAIGQPALQQFTNNTRCLHGENAPSVETDDGVCYTATATFFQMPFSIIRMSTSSSEFASQLESLQQVGVVFPLELLPHGCKQQDFESGKLTNLVMESCACSSDYCNGAQREEEQPRIRRRLKSIEDEENSDENRVAGNGPTIVIVDLGQSTVGPSKNGSSPSTSVHSGVIIGHLIAVDQQPSEMGNESSSPATLSSETTNWNNGNNSFENEFGLDGGGATKNTTNGANSTTRRLIAPFDRFVQGADTTPAPTTATKRVDPSTDASALSSTTTTAPNRVSTPNTASILEKVLNQINDLLPVKGNAQQCRCTPFYWIALFFLSFMLPLFTV